MASWMRAQGAAPKATLIDGTSNTARAYGAKNTPHMFIIDPNGLKILDKSDPRAMIPAPPGPLMDLVTKVKGYSDRPLIHLRR